MMEDLSLNEQEQWALTYESLTGKINFLEGNLEQKQSEIDQMCIYAGKLEKVQRQAANVADMAHLAFQGWAISKDEQPAMVALFGALAALRRRLEQVK